MDRLGRFTERQLRAFDRAQAQREAEARADLIADTSMAMWGGKEAAARVRELRKKR